MKLLRLVALWTLVALAAAPEALAESIAREQLSLQLGDWTSVAELAYPAEGTPPFPTVVLIPGSGVADMDHTVVSAFEYGPEGPASLSSIFRDIAQRLAEQGFAVVRYNKRYVTGPNQADFNRFYLLTLDDFLDDARSVVETAKAHPLVDEDRLFLYGWSEGSTLAAALVAERDDVAGLILQAPVVFPWKDTFVYQTLQVGWPYLVSLVEDGAITGNSLFRGIGGDGGFVAKSIMSYLVDPSGYASGMIRVNPALDSDQDGRIALGSELTMASLLRLMDSAFQPGGYLWIYGPDAALPTVGDRLTVLQVPLLILQGGRDANVPPEGAKVLHASLTRLGHPDVTLRWYPELGHSLGETESVEKDNFQPIASEPLDDVVGWLKERAL